MLNLYITSGNKKDGKTFLTAGLAATMQSLGYNTSVYKPIQTCGIEINGFTQSPDLTYIKTVDPYINTYFSYIFKSKSEPLIAAEAENEFIDIENIHNEYNRIAYSSDCTIIDGDRGYSMVSEFDSTSQFVKHYAYFASEPHYNNILSKYFSSYNIG